MSIKETTTTTTSKRAIIDFEKMTITMQPPITPQPGKPLERELYNWVDLGGGYGKLAPISPEHVVNQDFWD